MSCSKFVQLLWRKLRHPAASCGALRQSAGSCCIARCCPSVSVWALAHYHTPIIIVDKIGINLGDLGSSAFFRSQSFSVALISRHLPPSAAISRHQPPSAAVSRHLPPSVAISRLSVSGSAFCGCGAIVRGYSESAALCRTLPHSAALCRSRLNPTLISLYMLLRRRCCGLLSAA
jgi:hypothetical protein